MSNWVTAPSLDWNIHQNSFEALAKALRLAINHQVSTRRDRVFGLSFQVKLSNLNGQLSYFGAPPRLNLSTPTSVADRDRSARWDRSHEMTGSKFPHKQRTFNFRVSEPSRYSWYAPDESSNFIHQRVWAIGSLEPCKCFECIFATPSCVELSNRRYPAIVSSRIESLNSI